MVFLLGDLTRVRTRTKGDNRRNSLCKTNLENHAQVLSRGVLVLAHTFKMYLFDGGSFSIPTFIVPSEIRFNSSSFLTNNNIIIFHNIIIYFVRKQTNKQTNKQTTSPTVSALSNRPLICFVSFKYYYFCAFFNSYLLNTNQSCHPIPAPLQL
jgi:hypothetical protein